MGTTRVELGEKGEMSASEITAVGEGSRGSNCIGLPLESGEDDEEEEEEEEEEEGLALRRVLNSSKEMQPSPFTSIRLISSSAFSVRPEEGKKQEEEEKELNTQPEKKKEKRKQKDKKKGYQVS
jgi:hypothetical protein